MSNAWVEIDLDAIRSNVRAVRAAVKPWVEVIAMVKGNAYGHGALEVAGAVLDAGAGRLGVAFLDEAIELREAGYRCPILLLGSYSSDDIRGIVDYGITPAVWDVGLATALGLEARRLGRRLPVHVDVDTGMGRLGVRFEKAPFFVENLRAIDGLYVEGIYTHLSSADETDQAYSRLQLRRFAAVLERLREAGQLIPFVHVQNSAGVFQLPDISFSGVRPGLALYGMAPTPQAHKRATLTPVLSFHSKVVVVKRVPADTFVSYNRTYRTSRETTLATVSVGYADGYDRHLSNLGRVLIGGRSHPIAGRVTMDHIVVDVGDMLVTPGDAVTLIGRDGDVSLSAEDLATWAGTISYEITTQITRRVKRQFRGRLSTPAQVPDRRIIELRSAVAR